MSFTADPIEDLSEVIQNREYSIDIFENIPATSQDELKTVLFYLRDEAYRDSDRALKALSEAEDILQQAYTGRYLFELIQNVRDANKAAEIEGSIYIKIEDGILTIANTGTAFTKKGFRSITTIGDSTKDSKDFIGFKGIGFKSIQEISDTPRIVTAYGTVVFDRNLSFKELAGKVRSIKDIPLFFIPHFLPETLTNEELQNNIVTKIVLPLRP